MIVNGRSLLAKISPAQSWHSKTNEKKNCFSASSRFITRKLSEICVPAVAASLAGPALPADAATTIRIR